MTLYSAVVAHPDYQYNSVFFSRYLFAALNLPEYSGGEFPRYPPYLCRAVRIIVNLMKRSPLHYSYFTHRPPTPVPLRLLIRRFWNVPTQVFCSKQFVSEVNTLKVIAPSVLVARAEKSRHVQASDALEPLDPCGACTLRPPCQHISEQVRPKSRDIVYGNVAP